MIKAVLFDIDGVLVNSTDANLQFYQNLFVKSGYKPPTFEEYLPFMHYTMEEVIKNFTHASEREVRRIWRIGKELHYPYELLIVVQNGKEIIKKLSRIYRLGLVTNRIKNGIDAILSVTNLQEYFQIAVGVEDTKKHKPHPDPLLFAANKLHVNPEDIVYIGDAESDVIAARAAGMKVILFADTNFANADAHTAFFADLPAIVKKLSL